MRDEFFNDDFLEEEEYQFYDNTDFNDPSEIVEILDFEVEDIAIAALFDTSSYCIYFKEGLEHKRDQFLFNIKELERQLYRPRSNEVPLSSEEAHKRFISMLEPHKKEGIVIDIEDYVINYEPLGFPLEPDIIIISINNVHYFMRGVIISFFE